MLSPEPTRISPRIRRLPARFPLAAPWALAATLVATLAANLAGFAAPAFAALPSLDEQRRAIGAPRGSALERLIADNQEFYLLEAAELSDDRRELPLWLRVWWRKFDGGFVQRKGDASGGYPLVLKEIAEWMRTHPTLEVPAAAYDGSDDEPFARVVADSANLSVSGAAPSPRSESDIRIFFSDPNRVVAGSNNISSAGNLAMFASSDAGRTWRRTLLPLVDGDSFHSDPTVDWTSDGTAWATVIGISQGSGLRLRSYRSTDFGLSWTFDAIFSGSQDSADKQMIWIDHSATSAFRDRLYAIWHAGPPVFVNRRTGPAGSWGAPLRISGAETTGTGIGSDIKTNSTGDVFAWWPDTGSRGVYFAKSTNGGTSYSTPRRIARTFDSFDIPIPAMASRRALIYTTGGAFRRRTRNQVVAVWNDLSGAVGCRTATDAPGTNVASPCTMRLWIGRSTDGGTTWLAARQLAPTTARVDQFNPWLAVDETSGRMAVIYYESLPGDRRKTHVYFRSSTDGGATWSAPFRVTTAPTDESIAGADSGNQYGDYNGLSAYAGRFLPSWTDRRGSGREQIFTARLREGAAASAASGAAGVGFEDAPAAAATDPAEPESDERP